MSSLSSFQRVRTSLKAQRRFSVGIRLIISLILIFFSVFPILWMISASLNPTGSLATQTLIPENAGLDNYRELLNSEEFPFWVWLWNSVKIASIRASGANGSPLRIPTASSIPSMKRWPG